MVQETNIAVTVVQRLAYYDRNTTTIGSSGNNLSIGPHGNTARITYTVPANRKALISSGTNHTQRQTAGALAGLSGVFQGGGAGNVAQAVHNDNTAPGAVVSLSTSPSMNLNAGGTWIITTFDLGSTGTQDYSYAFGGTEFDA